MKKRILSIVLTLCMVLMLVPATAFAEENAETSTGTAPSVSAYATKAQLMDGTFVPNAVGKPNNIGKLVFGSNGQTPQEWYILGKDEGVSGDNTIIFATSTIGNTVYFNADWNDKTYNYSAGTGYGDSDGSIAVYANHYGASVFRNALNNMVTDSNTSYFSAAEKGLLNATTVTTNDTKNNLDYTTTDKLYALAAEKNGSSSTIQAGSGRQVALARNSYWNTGGNFFMRTAAVSGNNGILCADTDYGVNTFGVNSSYAVRPASNLNLSSALFASAATAASSGTATSGTIVSGTAMTLRLNGSSKNIGTVTYSTATGDIEATKGSNAGNVALVVQGNDGTNDWYYSKQITDTETVNVAAIKSALNLSADIDLSACEIWLETTEDNVTYAVTVKGCSTYTELRDALNAGITSIRLTDNITLTDTLNLSDKMITLDLNGHVLTGNIILTDSSAAPNSILTLIDSDPVTGGVLNGNIELTRGSYGNASHLYANGGTVTGKVSLNSYVASIYCTSNTPTAMKGYVGNSGGIHGGIFYSDINEDCIKEKTVTFMNGSSRYALEVVADGSNVAAPVSSPVKAGYDTFDGWYDGDTAFKFGSPLNENITLIAKFSNPTNYQIVCDLDGGEATNQKSYTVESEAITLNNPTKTGYTFTGWSGTGLTGENNMSVTIPKGSTGNRTYTAHFSQNSYTVAFDTTGGSSINDKTDVKWTDTVLSDITAPTKDGWEFKGWKCGDMTVGTDTTYADLAADDATTSITLVAQWKDIAPPTGEISIDTNKWTETLNNITFGLFFKNRQTVEITASDNSGDVATIEYLLSNQELSAADLGNATFITYNNTFSINPDNEYVIYARLTDASGNVAYINSDGIVLDATAPVISGVENGKTYCSAQTVTVTETYISSVTVNNEKVALDENNQFTLSPKEGIQTVVVTDKAGNKAEMIVTVNNGHTYEWQSENGQYWKKCKFCNDETIKKDIPTITINGADRVCVTQDYKFSFTLPEAATDAFYGYEFEMKGEGFEATIENNESHGRVSAQWYDLNEDDFKVYAGAKTADGFVFSVSKMVAFQREHVDVEPKDYICDICGSHVHCICGGEITAGDHYSHDSVTYQAWDGSLENRSPKGIAYTDGEAYVFLENDAELTECIEVVGNKTLVLCLNGKKLERKDIEGGTSDQKKFIVKDGARLVICDCQGGGSIICGPSAGKGGAFYIENGATMDFFGGKITNSSAEYGGAIAVTDLTPSADVFNPSTLNIYGGEISGNTATENGGAVYVSPNCKLNIYGDPVVKDNTAVGKANNIYLPSGQKLSVNDMKSGASIGITTESKDYPVAFTDVCDKDYSQYFHADLEGLHASYSGSNQLELNANQYAVTLNANGGTINKGDVTGYTYGEGAILPTDVTRTGYTFKGWYDNEELTGETVTDISDTDIEDKTFYAKWEVNKYTVKLNKNGGTINKGDVTGYKYGEGATLPTDVTRTGYTFAGWYDNEELTGEIVEIISTTEVDNKEYWAKWETNTYSYTLDTNDGIINKHYYKYGQQTILPTAEDITFTGHIFKGWYDNKELAGEPVTIISDTDLGDKIFYAKWEHTSDTSTITKITKATTSTEGTIVESCRRCDETLATTVIPKIETVKLSASKLTYTGSGQVPLLTVEDAEGNTLNKDTDYTVSGLDKKTSVGRYKVTITFQGNYEGTEELYFIIVPKAPASAKAALTSYYGTSSYNDVKFSWAKVENASGYTVYYKKKSEPESAYKLLKSTTGTYVYKKDLADGVGYTFKVMPYYKDSKGNKYENVTGKTATVYTLKKLATPTVTRNGIKVKVKWTNIYGESGYQISKSTTKTGTNIVSTYPTTTENYKLISATKGKTYYYKVRAYKTVDGKKIYGPWSNVTKYKR